MVVIFLFTFVSLIFCLSVNLSFLFIVWVFIVYILFFILRSVSRLWVGIQFGLVVLSFKFVDIRLFTKVLP